MDCREMDQTFAVPIGWIAINLQILLHFAPSNSDVIINFSMQLFYRCEHVSMLTSAF